MSTALIPLLKRFEDGEPRVRDIDLAVALAYERPTDIRYLSKRHADQLEEFGVIHTVRTTSGALGGRPTDEYWYTERQALLLCTYATTAKADEVRVVLVEAFYQYRHGALVPIVETIESRSLEIQANTAVASLLVPIQMKLTQLDQRVNRVETTVERIETKQDETLILVKRIDERTQETAECVKHQRKEIRKRDRAIHLDYLEQRHAGLCIYCCAVVLVKDHMPTEECTFDHWFGRHKAGLHETSPACRQCNDRLDKDPDFKARRSPAFNEYQYGLKRYLGPALFAHLDDEDWRPIT